MRLRDLANGNAKADVQPEPDAKSAEMADASPAGRDDIKWIVMESRLLSSERFLLIFDRKLLREARKEHPDKAIYFPPEIDELYKHRVDKEFIKNMHLAKKKFRGWVVPSKSKPRQGGANDEA